MAKIQLTKWSAATLYHLRQQLTIDQIAALPQWKMPTKTQESSMGIMPIYEDQHAVPINNSGVWFRIRLSKKKPVTSEFNRLVGVRIETLKGKGKGKVDSVKMPKTEYQGIQDEVHAEMLKTTHPKHDDVDVMFSGDWFVVTSSSANTCDAITKFLRDNLDSKFSVAVATMSGDEPLSKIGVDILESPQLIKGNIELSHQVKAKRDGAGVSVNNVEDYDEDLLAILQSADEVQSMTVTWGTEYTAKVNSDFSFSGVKFNVETDAEGDNDIETGHLRDLDRATDFISSMPKFLKDLAVHCDGLAELPEHDEQGVIDFEARKNQRKQAVADTEASSA